MATTISPTAFRPATGSGAAPLLAITRATKLLIASTTSSEAYNQDWYCSSKNSRFNLAEVVVPTNPCNFTNSFAYFSSLKRMIDSSRFARDVNINAKNAPSAALNNGTRGTIKSFICIRANVKLRGAALFGVPLECRVRRLNYAPNHRHQHVFAAKFLVTHRYRILL